MGHQELQHQQRLVSGQICLGLIANRHMNISTMYSTRDEYEERTKSYDDDLPIDEADDGDDDDAFGLQLNISFRRRRHDGGW